MDTPSEADAQQLLCLLTHGWLHRRHLKRQLGWSERKVRIVAEAAGDRIVRGPKGFTLARNATAEDLRICAERAISQGKKMIRYGLAIKRRAHQLVG